ncbi:MAG: PIG-L family deacetylase [Ignavibacteriales bacterium]|nr:PIG-L family deacetylase [Ignavibacteriales bacterium]
MMISLKPGYEDAAALAYFRLGKGARVLSVYVSNGEGGQPDDSSLYPHEIAARRRGEAYRFTRALDCDHLFMNLPDIVAASDSQHVRSIWPRDTLATRIRELFSRFRPDVVLFTGDLLHGEKNPQIQVLRQALQKALQGSTPAGGAGEAHWTINRVFFDEGSGKGMTLETGSRHSILKKTYAALGEEALKNYSLATMGEVLGKTGKRTYTLLSSARGAKLKKMDEGLPPRVSSAYRSLENEIQKLTTDFSRENLTRLNAVNRDRYLKSIALVMESVDREIPKATERGVFEIKSLARWKTGLENLRNVLLGVSVSFSLSEAVLAPRQLTFLKIDSVTGIQEEGTKEIYFPITQQGWIVDENIQPRLALRLNEPYGLLSPPAGTFDVPWSIDGLRNEKFARQMYFLIIHRSRNPLYNFVYRQSLDIFLSQKFTVEVQAPVVFARDGEQLPVRLTNHSRDGVRDSICVMDQLVTSEKKEFRLNAKGAVWSDTLTLSWKSDARDSTYLLSVKIADNDVAHFVARKFEVEAPAIVSLGVITAGKSTPLLQTLQRLNMHPAILELESMPSLASFQCVVVDRGAFARLRGLTSQKRHLDEFVEAGGHLVVLAQNAASWNRNPLMKGIHLEPTFGLDAESELAGDSLSDLLTTPHRLTHEDWSGWIFSRGVNKVRILNNNSARVLLSAKVGRQEFPLVVTEKAKAGRRTYVDLNLDHQWLNVHPGAFRFLVNLVSYDHPQVRTQ